MGELLADHTTLFASADLLTGSSPSPTPPPGATSSTPYATMRRRLSSAVGATPSLMTPDTPAP
jgi:hypothetical protein